MQNRGMEIIHGAHVLDGFVSELVGSTIAERRFHAGAGHPGREAVRIMIATAGSSLKRWHATELGAPHNQGIFQQASLFHVSQQSRGRLVENGAMLAVLLMQLLMPIPIAHTFPAV